jgi:hypothetical protein
MSFVVSKNGLSLIHFDAIEGEASGQWAAKAPQTLQGLFPALVAADFKLAGAGDAYLNLIAVLQIQGFDNRGGQTNRKAVSPFGDLHGDLLR